jgi:hexokinase
MADVPQNLLQQIKDFEEIFTVDRAKLKQVVDHFVKELEKGKPSSLPIS